MASPSGFPRCANPHPITARQRVAVSPFMVFIFFLMEKDRGNETTGKVGWVIAGLTKVVSRLKKRCLFNPSTHLKSTLGQRGKKLREAEVAGKREKRRNRCMSYITNRVDGTPRSRGWFLGRVLKKCSAGLKSSFRDQE